MADASGDNSPVAMLPADWLAELDGCALSRSPMG